MKKKKFLVRSSAVLLALYLVLMIPLPESAPPVSTLPNSAFLWDNTAFWQQLESGFKETRASGCESAASGVTSGLLDLDEQLSRLGDQSVSADDLRWDSLELAFFNVALQVAACPDHAADFSDRVSQLRGVVKTQSIGWDVQTPAVRDRVYRLLYGTRAALEEVMVQAKNEGLDLELGDNVPSETPHTTINGRVVHSGDMLVSRGDAATSALIARGSDYPGNFSHVALVHVGENGKASVIEAHIEKGVAVSTFKKYFADKKLRLLQIRLRADLPQLKSDPLLPHKAAEAMLLREQREHIAYDFAMDYQDPRKLFCSEVASSAYAGQGVHLWAALSTISSPGVQRWLSEFGVRHFTTQEPSDLEYDPQVSVVAEWRNLDELKNDRLANAVVDAMLASPMVDSPLAWNRMLLPFARIMKAYSLVLNSFGGVGPIPEGMSAVAALRNDRFTKDHKAFVADLGEFVAAFVAREGYAPPYWTLVDQATTLVAARSGSN